MYHTVRPGRKIRWILAIESFLRQVGHFFWNWIALIMQLLQKMCPHIVEVSSFMESIHIAHVSFTSFTSTGRLLLFDGCPCFLFLTCFWTSSSPSSEIFIGTIGGTIVTGWIRTRSGRPLRRDGICTTPCAEVLVQIFLKMMAEPHYDQIFSRMTAELHHRHLQQW